MCLGLYGRDCSGLTKCLFIITNLGIMIGALVMVVIYYFVVELAKYGQRGEGIVFLVINIIAFFIPIIGIEATICSRKDYGLNIYIVAMPIIAIGNLILKFVTFNRQFPNEAFTDNFGNILGNRLLSSMFDLVYEKFNCCGFNGPEDYTAAEIEIPSSCKDYTKGCFNLLVNPYRKLVENLIEVIWANIIIECIGVFLSLWIACMSVTVSDDEDDR